jgi:hypothetical protein
VKPASFQPDIRLSQHQARKLSVKTLPPKASLRRAIIGPMLFLLILGDVLGAGVMLLPEQLRWR